MYGKVVKQFNDFSGFELPFLNDLSGIYTMVIRKQKTYFSEIFKIVIVSQ